MGTSKDKNYSKYLKTEVNSVLMGIGRVWCGQEMR